MKEGCAINQSLTNLGSVISVLAEKATGKGAGKIVPYRNSSLTRILQNSLGGNSKTIMICAISPSASNFDESLGTLRYADRAKKIVNKAIINESAQDKVIRELREENEELKKMLDQFKSMMETGGGASNQIEEDELITNQASNLGFDLDDSFIEATPMERRQTVAKALMENVEQASIEIAE